MQRRKLTIAVSVACILAFANLLGAQRRGRTSSASSNDATARQLAADYWKKYLIKCGGSHFLFSDDRLFEFRDTPQYSFNGQSLTPRSLSRAEVLNGVDPLPVQWEGNMGVSFNVCRMNTAYYSVGGVQTYWHGWGAWNSNSCGYSTKLTKAKGQWTFFRPKEITCDQLSNWGFVFIPAGVRGAAAERRAEYDAETVAMRRDASRFGIYISDAPPFPMRYFRTLYSIAARNGLYKVKFFPNSYYAIWSYQGYGIDHRFPNDMEAAYRDSIRKSSHALREAEITADGAWIVVASDSSDYYNYAAKNVPQTLIDALEKLRSQNKSHYLSYIDEAHRPKLIAIAPNKNWVVFYGENSWTCSCPSELQLALTRAAGDHKLKQVVFAPNDGWLIQYGARYFEKSSDFPKDIIEKLTELYNQDQTFDQVIFAPNGSWAIGGKLNDAH